MRLTSDETGAAAEEEPVPEDVDELEPEGPAADEPALQSSTPASC